LLLWDVTPHDSAGKIRLEVGRGGSLNSRFDLQAFDCGPADRLTYNFRILRFGGYVHVKDIL
jgi:hypothetical protein